MAVVILSVTIDCTLNSSRLENGFTGDMLAGVNKAVEEVPYVNLPF